MSETADLVWRLRSAMHYGIEATMPNPLCQEAADRIEALERALKPFADAPSNGLWGGPLIGAVIRYEDGTDENTARHRGWLDHAVFTRARNALKGTSISLAIAESRKP